jgi:preprotein translocase subunit SecE
VTQTHDTPGGSASSRVAATGAAASVSRGARLRGLPSRVALFYRQVLAELRKVVWPTRKELITYTSVVIVFVGVVLAFVYALDLVFARFVFWVFG